MELGTQLLESNNEKQGSNLKAEREAITPGQESYYDSESDLSLSEDEEDVKVEVKVEPERPEDKNESKEKQEVRQEREKDYKFVEHYVDPQYLALMIILRRQRLINLPEISGLKEGSISLLGKHSKIIVRAGTKAGEQAIDNLSSFIERLNIQKTAIKYEAASRIVHFRRLKAFLSRDKIAIFGARSKDQYELYIGGEMKGSELRAHLHKINQLKVQPVFLRVFQNKRSYRLIIEEILNTEYMQKALLSFNNVNFAEVERRNNARELRVVLGSFAKREITPPQYEDCIMKHLSNFYVITFCLDSEQKYLEKLKCEGVSFLYLKERKFSRSYVYVIALRQDFQRKSAEIALQLEKIGEKIMGIRFFNKLHPEITSFDFDEDKDKYQLFRFPPSKPYSITITARRKEGNQFKWKEVYEKIVALQALA